MVKRHNTKCRNNIIFNNIMHIKYYHIYSLSMFLLSIHNNMKGDHIEYLQFCYIADNKFNEYFDMYLFYKNVLEIMNLDINTQNKNEYNEMVIYH